MRQSRGSLFWIPFIHAKPFFGRLKQPKFLKCRIWRGEGSRLPVRGPQGLEWGERGAVRSFTKWRQKCWLRRAAMSAPAKSFHSSWQRMTSIDTSTRGKDATELQCPLYIATLDIAAALPIATSTPVTNLRQYINSDLGYNDLKF